MKRKMPRADHADDADGLTIDAILLARDIARHDGSLNARRKRCRFECDSVCVLPLDIGFDTSAARLPYQPADNLFASFFHDVRGAPENLGSLRRATCDTSSAEHISRHGTLRSGHLRWREECEPTLRL